MADENEAYIVNIPDGNKEIRRKLRELATLERRTIGSEVAALVDREYERLIGKYEVLKGFQQQPAEPIAGDR